MAKDKKLKKKIQKELLSLMQNTPSAKTVSSAVAQTASSNLNTSLKQTADIFNYQYFKKDIVKIILNILFIVIILTIVTIINTKSNILANLASKYLKF